MGVSRASCSEMWGLEETSRGWRIWLIFAVLLGFIVNFIAVLGCLSDATSSIHLYKVRQTDLLAAVEIVANRSADDFRHDGLPEVWYWGLSGVCDSNHHCNPSFPPTPSLGSIIQTSLSASLLPAHKQAYASALAPWASAIRSSSIDGSSPITNPRLHADRHKFLSFSKASAAMSVLALLTSATVLATALATASSRRVPLWALYLGTFFDAVFLLAALVLAVYAMNTGPRSLLRLAQGSSGGGGVLSELKNPGTYLGPGMFTLAAGVLVKFLAIAGVFVGFLIFGIISLVTACLAAMCACACLAGAVGSDGRRYRCSNCGYQTTYNPAGGSCGSCGAYITYY